MEERKIPARFTQELLQAVRPEGSIHRALDARGETVRLVISHPEAASGLMLRQAHAALMRLAHPHVAAAVALEPVGDVRWLSASEWVSPTLNPSPEQVLAWLPGWLAGLGHLHQAGFVHGALSPEALGRSADGTPKLASVGRGWRIGQRGAAEAGDAFAAPEARSFARVDGRSDLWSLGAVCHFWLTGRVPMPGDAPETDGWPEALAQAVTGMLEAAPAHRLPTACAALEALGGEPMESPERHATPFVGRRAELDRLLELASEVADAGVCRVMAVSGEAGVGKTRLLEELRQRLVLRGFGIATAGASGRADGAPYGAWAPVLDTLAGRVDANVLARLAPVLVGLVRGVEAAPAPIIEPRAARMRLFRAIASLIEEAAGPEGLAVFLDDWHMADEASVELLSYMKRALPAVGVLIVLATEADGPTGEAGLQLGRFGEQEVGQLLRHVQDRRGPGGPDGGLVTTVGELTDGHPALVEEAVLEAVGAGAIAGRASSGPRAQLALPKTFQALWAQRLAGCTTAARALAGAAAIAGAGAGHSLLKAVSGQAEEAFLQSLDELLDAGVISHDGTGFTLAAPAALASAQTPPDAARAAHEEALSYWRVAAQLGQAVNPSLLAHHALGAKDDASGAYYALAAAKEALKLFATEEAGRLLERSAACLEALPDAPAAWRAELATAQGDYHRYMGQGAEAERRFREALAYAPSQPPYRLSELLTSLGLAFGLQARSVEAEAAFLEALAHPAMLPPTRARAATALARLYVRLGRAEEAAALAGGVLAMDDAPALYRGEALGLMGLICVTGEAPRAVEGLRYLEEACELAMAAGDRLALNNACMLAGNARMALGQLPEAKAAFERNFLLCTELGLTDEQACATLNLAQVAFEQGRLVEAWERAVTGGRAAAEIGNRIYEVYGKIFSGLAGCHLGRLGEADQAFAQGLAIAQQLGHEHLILQVLLAQLEAALFLGRLGRAEDLGLELARRQEAAGIHEFAGRHALLMGQLYELAGEVEEAIGYYQRARGFGEGTGSATLLAGAALGAAMVALRAGQNGVAAERAEEAHDLAASAGADLGRLQALLVRGRAAWALGDAEGARGVLLEADGLAAELSSPHWQAMVWQFRACLSTEEAPLRRKAGVFYQFYMQQLPPRARQEFLNWPERRDAVERALARPVEQGGHEDS